MLGPNAQLNIVDQGYAQLIDIEDGFSQVEVLLGIDAKDLEVQLLDGRLTDRKLDAKCRAQRPDCHSQIIEADHFIGFVQDYSFFEMKQAKLRMLSAGESVTVRVTFSGDTSNADLQRTAKAVFEVIRPALMTC
ncbi:MAG: hypothetical protein AAF557_16955 [Pseudomonadota bacterium]